MASMSASVLALSAAGVHAQEAAADSDTVIKSHGYSFFGDLKYPADYAHFDFVNPEAPQGGEISIQSSGTFDSMNPYTVKGRAGALASMMYESLLVQCADDYHGSYGLLAESLEYDKGKTWVIFHLRQGITFSDGTPMTAADVVFTHNLFIEQGLPSYSSAVKKRVLSAEAVDEHTVKFTFATGISRRSLISQVGSTPVFSKAWFDKTGARLDESRFDVPPGTGPYMLDSYQVNRRILYKRNRDYWGNGLPVNVGRWNFDTIRVEYFGDESAAFEAFKAGEYTFRQESSSRQWATQYDFPAVQAGHVVKEDLPDGNPPSNAGFVFNLGRAKFADKKVRQAIALAYNFEWTNQSLQYGLFQHRQSYFQDTPLQAKGVPQGDELDFMNALGDVVPEVLKTEAPVPVHTSSPDRLGDRKNMRAAMKLLDEAGWKVGDDGIRRNDKGEVLSITFPVNSASASSLEPILDNYAVNLKQIGIRPDFSKADPSQYTNLRRNRDYDMIYDGYQSGLDTGTGLMQMYGSEDADISVFNPAGLKSKLVDSIIEASLHTDSQEMENASLSVLDRALQYEFIMVPTWYKAGYWVAHFDMYGHPDIPPYDMGYLDFWWYEKDKADALKAAGALR
nr:MULTISPECIES: extracellular solute-binding protein [Pseudooceanicola]